MAYNIAANQTAIAPPDTQGIMTRSANLGSIGLQQQKAQQDLQAGAMQAHLQKAQMFGETMKSVASLPADQQPQAYAQARNQLLQNGVIKPEDAPEQHDPMFLGSTVQRYNQTAPAIENRLKTSHASLMDAEAMKNRAEGMALMGKDNGKALAAEQADKMAGHESAMGLIGDLRQAMNANKESMGPVMGRLASMNPYDTRGQALQGLVKKAAQAIGKSLEGGKLTDADYAKYTKMLPNQSDTLNVANAKIDQLERLVNTQKNAEITAYQKSGYDTSKFQPAALRELDITQPPPGRGGSMIASAQAASPPVKPGASEGGYVFMGGDPANPKSWKKAK